MRKLRVLCIQHVDNGMEFININLTARMILNNLEAIRHYTSGHQLQRSFFVVNERSAMINLTVSQWAGHPATCNLTIANKENDQPAIFFLSNTRTATNQFAASHSNPRQHDRRAGWLRVWSAETANLKSSWPEGGGGEAQRGRALWDHLCPA